MACHAWVLCVVGRSVCCQSQENQLTHTAAIDRGCHACLHARTNRGTYENKLSGVLEALLGTHKGSQSCTEQSAKMPRERERHHQATTILEACSIWRRTLHQNPTAVTPLQTETEAGEGSGVVFLGPNNEHDVWCVLVHNWFGPRARPVNMLNELNPQVFYTGCNEFVIGCGRDTRAFPKSEALQDNNKRIHMHVGATVCCLLVTGENETPGGRWALHSTNVAARPCTAQQRQQHRKSNPSFHAVLHERRMRQTVMRTVRLIDDRVLNPTVCSSQTDLPSIDSARWHYDLFDSDCVGSCSSRPT